MRRVVFRADASTTIGIGHVMRCLTLAKALRERETTVSFICRAYDGHLCDLIEERGFQVGRLPVITIGARDEAFGAHGSSMGGAWQQDAEQTCAAMGAAGARPDWLIVDHYALDDRWEKVLRASVGRIMVIDDLADRTHDCDLLLDQNLVAQMDTRYAGKVPTACTTLLGPQYAMLQPIYRELHDRVPPRKGAIRRILISFGGGDHQNLTGRSISAFLRLDRSDIHVDVVIGAAWPNGRRLAEQVAEHDNIHLHGGPPTLAPLIAGADLAVGACGVTTWERLCLGLPALVVTVAQNQRPIAAELNRRGLVRWLGHEDQADESVIAQALREQLESGLGEDWSRQCLAEVDGRGADRVRAVLTVTTETALRVRRSKAEDERLLLQWANDPTTRRNAFSQEPIRATTHREWFRSRLDDVAGCRLYIVETSDGVGVGQVRFQRQEHAWEVHYGLAPAFRGRGLGGPLLKAALIELRAEMGDLVIFGQVKDVNRASRRVFESLGFETQANAGGGRVVYRRAL